MQSLEERTTNRLEAMPLGWYAAYTRHQHEKSSTHLLEQKGLEVFLPLYHAVHRWKDRRQVVVLPVFPCYVFVRTDLESRLKILHTPGICQLVGVAGRPSRIPDYQIESIRTLVQSPASFEPHPYLKRGDRVYVRGGPLAGIEGILTRFKNEYRVVLSVDLLQRSVAAEVDMENVERVLGGGAAIPGAIAAPGGTVGNSLHN